VLRARQVTVTCRFNEVEPVEINHPLGQPSGASGHDGVSEQQRRALEASSNVTTLDLFAIKNGSG